ncbi:MAG: metallopeptidase TldD-related protein [Thermoplasmataceae archaeon]
MNSADMIFEKLQKLNLNDIVVQNVREDSSQVRFSRDSKDIHNRWIEDSTSVFVSRGKKTASTVIKDYSATDSALEKLIFLLDHSPDNESFMGINPEKQEYSSIRKGTKGDADIQELASVMIDSAMSNGAERVAGLIYNSFSEVTVITPHNRAEYNLGGYELLIRAFRGEMTGQEATHTGMNGTSPEEAARSLGEKAAITASMIDHRSEGRAGKFRILMSPYLTGNIISYGSSFFSAYAVEAGFSCFADLLGKTVGKENLNIVDDPTDISGTGFRPVDDEGTVTFPKSIVENGELKTFLHSYSTALRSNTKTTGNAGIISPTSFQMKIKAGDSSEEEMISSLDEGLYIKNAWYTRFQDYRNGVFSTVPRDGVFYVKNGEIKEVWGGIRISDSIPSILSNIDMISRETQNVKWWEEIFACNMPSVAADNVTVTKAF